jgi:hypothetical protein
MSLKVLYPSPAFAPFRLRPGSKTGIQDQKADPRDKGGSHTYCRLNKIAV